MADEKRPGRSLRKRQARISYREKDEFDLEDLLEGEALSTPPPAIVVSLSEKSGLTNYSSPTQSTSNTASRPGLNGRRKDSSSIPVRVWILCLADFAVTRTLTQTWKQRWCT